MTPTDPPSPKVSARHAPPLDPPVAKASARQGSHHDDDHLYGETPQNEDVLHEHSDVNVRALAIFALGLVAVVVVCAIVSRGLFAVLERQAAANDPVMSPLARPSGELPPEPRLMLNEPENLQRFRADQAEAMKGIEEAKKRLMQQGLPVRADAPTDAWMGTHSSSRGESTGGRGIPMKPGSRGAPVPHLPSPAPAPLKSGGH